MSLSGSLEKRADRAMARPTGVSDMVVRGVAREAVSGRRSRHGHWLDHASAWAVQHRQGLTAHHHSISGDQCPRPRADPSDLERSVCTAFKTGYRQNVMGPSCSEHRYGCARDQLAGKRLSLGGRGGTLLLRLTFSVS
jgi:hypothetical protein